MITKQLQSKIKVKVTLGLLEALLATGMVLATFGSASYASAAAVTYSADTFVRIGSSDYQIISGSAATSVVNTSTTLTVIIPASSTFTLSSLDGYKLSNDAGVSDTCSGSTSTITVSGAVTVIITPDTTRAACHTSSGGGGGGGGGSSSTSATSVATTPAVTAPSGNAVGAQVSAILTQVKSLVAILESHGVTISAEIKSLLSTLGVPAGGTPASSTAVSGTTPVTFASDLKVGSKGANVSALQSLLIKKGYTLPSGATGFYGGQTKAAVAAYQKANGISPASGMFGPKTRAYVQAHP